MTDIEQSYKWLDKTELKYSTENMNNFNGPLRQITVSEHSETKTIDKDIGYALPYKSKPPFPVSSEVKPQH